MLAVFFVVVPCGGAQAKVQEIRVLAAGVDELSTTANDKAMRYARLRAVYLAAKKLGDKDPGKNCANLTEDQLGRIVRGMTVLQTKREGSVTYAEVMVTVVEEPLRAALGLPPADVVEKPQKMRGVLVLPVLVDKDKPYLWEKENTIKPLMEEALRRQSRGTVMSPAGDFGDLRLVDSKNVLKVKPGELQPMFDRYGAEEIIIPLVSPGAAGTSDATTVLMRRLQPASEHTETIDVAPRAPEESVADRLADAATAVAGAVTDIASATSDADRAALARAKKIQVKFLYANPRELASLQQAIRQAPGVIMLEIPSISLKDVPGTMYLNQDPQEVQTFLTKQGIRVNVGSDSWRVSWR